MVLLLVLVPVLVPEFKDPNPGRFDFLSVPLSMGAVLPVVYGVKESAAHGLDAKNALIIAAGLVVGLFFVRRQRGRADAMIGRELFRHRGFAAGIGLNALAAFAMMGSSFFTTQYLQSVLGMSTMEAALWSLAPSLAVGAAAPTATAIAQRTDRARVICAGFVIAAAGFAILALAGTDSLWLLLGGCAVMSSGIVTVMALVSDLALSTAPPEKASSAASLLETGQEFGGAMGMALLGAVATAIYTADMPGSAPEAARKTLAGAVATGDGSLIAVGREAFVHSMQYASVTGAALLLAGAVLAAVLLRRIPGAADTRTAAPTEAGADELARSGRGMPVRLVLAQQRRQQPVVERGVRAARPPAPHGSAVPETLPAQPHPVHLVGRRHRHRRDDPYEGGGHLRTQVRLRGEERGEGGRVEGGPLPQGQRRHHLVAA